jgi:hypothetical protein
MRVMVCLLVSTVTGLTVGTGLGALVAIIGSGLTIWLGMAIGTFAGILAGVLAVADTSPRFVGGGQWIGAGFGLAAFVALLAYAEVYGPGISPPSGVDLAYLFGLSVFSMSTGFLSGLLSERFARTVADC